VVRAVNSKTWTGLPLRSDGNRYSVPPISPPTAIARTINSSSQITLQASGGSSSLGTNTGYRYRRNGQLLNSVATASAYVDSGLTPATAYSYTATLVDSVGNESAISEVFVGTTTVASDSIPPSVPVITPTVLSASTIRVALTTPSTDAGGFRDYTLQTSVTAGGPWTDLLVAVQAASFPFTLSGLTPSSTRYFRAIAYDTTGNSSTSAIVNATTSSAQPGQESDPLPPVRSLIVVYPRAPGTAPEVGSATFPLAHRANWHHSQVPYRVYAHVQGGMEPYTHSITNASAPGLSIDAVTGLISYDGPMAAPITYTYTARDKHGTQISTTHTITQDDARFKIFSMSGNDTTGDGTFGNPWRNFGRVASSTTGDQICIFRGGPGSYSVAGLYNNGVTQRTVTTANFTPTTTSFELTGTASVVNSAIGYEVNGVTTYALVTGGSVQGSNFRVTAVHEPLNFPPVNGTVCGVGNTWQRCEFSSSSRSNKWEVFPGETAILDGDFQSASTNWGAMIRVSGATASPYYVKGFTPRNFLDKCFQVGAVNFAEVLDIRANALSANAAIGGSNPGVVMQLGGSYSYYGRYKNFNAIGCKVGALKTYAQNKTRYENIITEDSDFGWDLKSSQTDVEVVDCVFRGTIRSSLQGGMHGNMSATIGQTRAHFKFCLFDLRGNAAADALALDVGQDGVAGPLYVDRCTILKRAQVRNNPTSVAFRRCVILNDVDALLADRIYLLSTDAARVSRLENLSGGLASGIVDASGNLAGASRELHLYRRGWERGT
jgi:hypothetical protein